MNVTVRPLTRAIERRGLVLHVASVLLMSTSPVLDKFALAQVDPLSAVVTVYAFNVCLSVALTYRRWDRVTLRRAFSSRELIVMGIVNAAAIVLVFEGLALTDPVAVGLLRRFYVVFGVILGVWLLSERFRPTEAIGIVVALVGAVVFVSPDLSEISLRNTSLVGSALVLGSSLLFAYANLVAKKFVGRLSTMQILATNNVTVFPLVLAYALMVNGSISANAASLGFLGISAVLGSFVGLGLFYAGLKHSTYAGANVIRSLQPLVIVVYAAPFFPQAVTASKLVAGLFVVAGVVLLSLGSVRAGQGARQSGGSSPVQRPEASEASVEAGPPHPSERGILSTK